MNAHYDIAIIGGGMVGASLAVSLLPEARRRNLKLAVFEAYPLTAANAAELQPSYDARSTALSYGTRRLLEQMGVWSGLQERVAAIESIRVSDRGHFGATRLEAAQHGVPALGYVVENRCLGQVLLQNLEQDGGAAVDLLCPARVEAARPTTEGMGLSVDVDGRQRDIRADLVVMADGGRSRLREQMGIEYQQRSYESLALIANVSLDRPHRNVAYERFTDEGPMALLPLTGGPQGQARCALVWSLPQAECEALLSGSEADFLQRLQAQFGYRAGVFQAVGERHAYPLKLLRVREQVRSGLVVLGNAAHTLHPIAGQGFNLALRGALRLSEVLKQALARGEPLGALSTLTGFEQQLHWDQHKTIGFSDQVTRLFSNHRTGAVVARNLGLLALDLLPPAKEFFARSAMGLDIPEPQFSEGGRDATNR